MRRWDRSINAYIVGFIILCAELFFFLSLVLTQFDFSQIYFTVHSIYLQVALDSIGVSIWQMAAAPVTCSPYHTKDNTLLIENGHANGKIGDDDPDTSESEDDSDLIGLHEQPTSENRLVALACDDGCVRIYSISDSDKLTYVKSLTRVSGEISAPFLQMTLVGFIYCICYTIVTFVLLHFAGRVLSVTWSPDGNSIYSGSSDGCVNYLR